VNNKALSLSRAFGAVWALLVLGAIVSTFVKGSSSAILGSMLALSAVGIALQFKFQDLGKERASDVSQSGFLDLSFFCAICACILPPSIFGQAAIPFFQHIGYGIIVLSITSLPGIYHRDEGFTHGLIFGGLNSIRLLVVSLALCLPGLDLTTPTWPAVGAIALAFVLYVVFDKIVNSIVESVCEDANIRGWENVQKKVGPKLAGQVLQGVLAAVFAHAFFPATGLAWVATLVGIVTATSFSLALCDDVRNATDDLKVQDQEQLEIQLRQAQRKTELAKEENNNLSLELKNKATELDMLYDMARSLGASTNLNETMGIVQSMIRRLRIPYQSCVIFLLTERNTMEAAMSDTPFKEVLGMSGLLQLQEPLIQQVLRDQKPVLASELASSSEQRIFKDERSVICVPLIVGKENVGVIYIGSVNVKTHKEEHLEILKMLAAYAAPSIKTALLFQGKEQDLQSERRGREAVEAKNKQLAGLQKLGQAIGASLAIENTYKVLAETLQQMIPAAQSVILFITNPEDKIQLKAEFASSPYAEYVRTLQVRTDEGLLGKSIEVKSTLLVPDTQAQHLDLLNIINNERSVVVAPLTAEDENLGCLYVGANKENTFSEEHRSLIETVSYQAAIALKNARLYAQTQQLALTDGLTGLYTKRYFEVRLNEEIEWSKRTGKPICLVMVDTDKFKEFNDTLGHPAGDALLKEIASLLKDKVRSEDVVCRIGGDEFVLILKDNPKDKSQMICERVRETFQLRFAEMAVQVTASIGIACFPSDANTKDELTQAVDDALYVSKRTGRNRVTPAPTMEDAKHLPKIVQEIIPR
jgi:diguanylate cyclase (GGDEF)-like protein